MSRDRTGNVVLEPLPVTALTAEEARFRLITVEYGVPKARFISPTLDGAAHLFDAAADAGKPEALAVFTADDARTGPQCKTLQEYLRVLGY